MSGLEVKIEAMHRRHLAAVERVERELSAIPWSKSLFLQEISRSGDRYYRVAMCRRELVGFVGMMWVADEAHITNLGVSKRAWGKGIASRLLLDALGHASDGGIKDCTLEVRAGNLRAQRLYFRFGFVAVGVRRAYYHNNDEDAIIMWAYDLASDRERNRRAGIASALEVRKGDG